MFDGIRIKSHIRDYKVDFSRSALDDLSEGSLKGLFFIIDDRVLELHGHRLKQIIRNGKYLSVIASENEKNLNEVGKYVEKLLDLGLKRGDKLIVIGGGILQDLSCFLASILYRGIEWIFFPTTLLSQCDSCIGSKSSINCGTIKNVVGTFYPPSHVFIDTSFLSTLTEIELRSGGGEMLKVHAISSPKDILEFSTRFENIFCDESLMMKTIRDSLLIKKRLIEADEFDRGERLILNYGHSFGHAIESATDFRIPHGIAVTIGMDLANYISMIHGKCPKSYFDAFGEVLRKNFKICNSIKIPSDRVLEALGKDKKNSSSKLRLIMPSFDGVIKLEEWEKSIAFSDEVARYLNEVRYA